MYVLTDAHSRTLTKWNICVFRSTVFVSLCETVWIKLLWFWEVRWVIVDTEYRDVNPGTDWKFNCSSSSRDRQFVGTATFPVQKRKYRLISLSVSVNIGTTEMCNLKRRAICPTVLEK